MNEIKYVKGDATCPTGEGHRILMHICNNKGGWGKGFVLALSKKWKLPEQKYRLWYKSQENFQLGEVQFVGVGGEITVANMLSQDGYGGVAVKYAALRDCLNKVYNFAVSHKATIHAPKIGSGLGGANWDQIEPIIEEELCQKGIDVTIYEFNQ